MLLLKTKTFCFIIFSNHLKKYFSSISLCNLQVLFCVPFFKDILFLRDTFGCVYCVKEFSESPLW